MVSIQDAEALLGPTLTDAAKGTRLNWTGLVTCFIICAWPANWSTSCFAASLRRSKRTLFDPLPSSVIEPELSSTSDTSSVFFSRTSEHAPKLMSLLAALPPTSIFAVGRK